MNRCRSCQCDHARCVDLPITAGARACCSACDHSLPTGPRCCYCENPMDDNRVLCAHSDHCDDMFCAVECPDCGQDINADLRDQANFDASREAL